MVEYRPECGIWYKENKGMSQGDCDGTIRMSDGGFL